MQRINLWFFIPLLLIILYGVLPAGEPNRGIDKFPSGNKISPLISPDKSETCTPDRHNSNAIYVYDYNERGYQCATYYDPDEECYFSYPFLIQALGLTLTHVDGATWPLDLDIVIYDVSATDGPIAGPQDELYRFSISCDSASCCYPNAYIEYLPADVIVDRPFFVSIEYVDLDDSPYGSLLYDDSSIEENYQWQYTDYYGWQEWSDFWSGIVPGYPLIWLFGEAGAVRPDDFYISAVSGSLAPWGEYQSITIAADGTVLFESTDIESGVTDSWDLLFTTEQMDDLYDTVYDMAFFNLDTLYDSGISDGTGITVNIRASGQTHKVSLDNYGLEEINRLIWFINNLIEPETPGLYYNLLGENPAKGGNR